MNYRKPRHRKVLSFDIGHRRIGMAYCDSLHITVTHLPAIKRIKDFEEINFIKEIISLHNIQGLIFGLPLDQKGRMTKQAEDCKFYGEYISKELNMPYTFVNEHSSTWESISKYEIVKDKTGLVDSLSAKIILEQWIKEGPELNEFTFKKQIKY